MIVSRQPLIQRTLASVRVKTIVIIALGLLLMLMIGVVPFQTLIMHGFLQLEQQTMHTNVERVDQAIQFDLEQITNALGGWTPWDETYAYASTPNQPYLDANASDNWFELYDVNILVFANASGRILYSKYYDLDQHTPGPPPSTLLSHLTPNSSLLTNPQPDSIHQGLMLLPEGPLLLVARPILPSSGEGPSRGTVLLGRYLDQREIEELSRVTQFPFRISRIEPSATIPDSEALRAALVATGQSVVRPLNDATIAGYGLLRDVNGEPALITSVEQPRDIYAQGRLQSVYVMVALIAGGVVIGLIVLVLFDHLVLKRLIRLDHRVAHIGAGGDLTARVAVAGDDELAHLGHSINTMLNVQERIHAERIELEQARIADLERTAAEQRALVEQLQTSLLERAALSQTVQELSAPVIPVLAGTIVVPLVGMFTTQRANDLQETVLEEVQRYRASWVVIDVTGLRLFDTFIAQTILRLTSTLRLVGAESLLVGIRPEMAQTLVQLGVNLADQKVAADLQTAVTAIAKRSLLRPSAHR